MIRPASQIVLLLLALFALTAVFGDTLYKWVDNQGNVHYSDKPHPGATKMHLPNAQTYTPPATAARDDGAGQQQQTKQQSYSIQITSPSADQTFSNTQSVTVSVSLTPGLQQGDTVTISVDGQSHGPGDSLSATFDGLDRGQHTASATLREANGKVLSAPSVTFYIHRAAVKPH
ncbi:MAG TPA: DUF4124 domain-containing protein [Gammaproteobacteria bacterium]|jgi:hypothetical protein|nr:DUF4124 domain-containing protein [Gammaproteobacteria bacterium]